MPYDRKNIWRAVVKTETESKERLIKEIVRPSGISKVIRRTVEITEKQVEVLECGHRQTLIGKPARRRRCWECMDEDESATDRENEAP